VIFINIFNFLMLFALFLCFFVWPVCVCQLPCFYHVELQSSANLWCLVKDGRVLEGSTVVQWDSFGTTSRKYWNSYSKWYIIPTISAQLQRLLNKSAWWFFDYWAFSNTLTYLRVARWLKPGTHWRHVACYMYRIQATCILLHVACRMYRIHVADTFYK